MTLTGSCLRTGNLIALMFLLFTSLLAQADEPVAPESDWKLITDRNGIQVYMSHRDDSRLKTFRGVTRIRITDEYSVTALLEDYPNMPRWLHFIDHVEEVGRDGPLRRQLRFATSLPWPVADREALLYAYVQQSVTPEQEVVSVHLENAYDLLPLNRRYVRFPELQGLFSMKRLNQNNEVEVTYQVVMDPGGYIPAWLSNMLLRDAPYFTLERMRRMLARTEYHNTYLPYIQLFGPGRPADAEPAYSYILGNPPAEPFYQPPPGSPDYRQN